MVDRLGIEAQPDAARAAKRFDFVQQRLGDDAFAVIADDHGVRLAKFRFDFGQQTPGEARVQAVAGFAVNADDLLLVGDDAGFDAGMARRIGEQSAAVDVLSAEKFFQMPAVFIVANHAEKFRGHVERGQIARDVGRAAGHEAFAFEIHDGHRRLRRNARHAAPDEMVKHHVTDDQDAGFTRGGQQFPDALNR